MLLTTLSKRNDPLPLVRSAFGGLLAPTSALSLVRESRSPLTGSAIAETVKGLAPTSLRILLCLAATFLLAASAGCAHLNNPFKDSSAAIDDEMTTPSAEGTKGHAEFGRETRRDIAVSEVRYENGAVSHWPLWWEDPFEDKGNRTVEPADRDAPDTAFVWNWVDYFHIAYGPGRMVFVNTLGWPISAVVTPPGTLMESDGHIDKGLLGYDHDAKRSDSVTREPPDINIIKKPAPEPPIPPEALQPAAPPAEQPPESPPAGQ